MARNLFSRRSGKGEMNLRERTRLSRLVHRFLLDERASNWSYSQYITSEFTATVQTVAGRLTVTHCGHWLACRFEEPERAYELLGDRINRVSGKWNFHFGKITGLEAFTQFKDALEPILASNEGPTHPN